MTVTQIKAPPLTSFISPRYWPTWLGISLLCLLAYTPSLVRINAGRLIGLVSYKLARERRYITRTNIRLCFPHLGVSEQQELVRKTFLANGIGLIETATGWVRSAEHFRDQVCITGLNDLLQAKSLGRGVLMLGAHYSTLDFAANLLSLSCPFAVTYRPHRNRLFDAFMQRGRLRNCNGVFDRNDIRGALKHLKKGEVLWYAPDQDYGPEHSVYVPFFNNTAATITIPGRFARVNNSPVVMVRHHRREKEKGYELDFTVVTENFPSDDDSRDAALINKKIEAGICHYPHQYLWMHKRFKTQPEGKPASPYIAIKTPFKKLSKQQLNTMVTGASTVEEVHSRDRILKLENGLLLRFFPGVPGKIFRSRHPSLRFDLGAKWLRTNGIYSVTVDNIFRVPELNLTAVSAFPVDGKSVPELLDEDAGNFPIKALSAFMAKLHQKGFYLGKVRTDKMVFSKGDFYLLNPETIIARPSSICYLERCENITSLLQSLDAHHPATKTLCSTFCNEYAEASGLRNNSEFTSRLFKLSQLCLNASGDRDGAA